MLERYYRFASLGLALAALSATGQIATAPPDRIELKYVQPTGTRLAYVETGRGLPVVLVHGAFSDYRSWAAQLTAVSSGLRLIAYSRRDFHPNERDTGPELQTADRDVTDLIELIEALGIAPVHLVGHSAGGHAALAATIRRPDLVRSLVLEEGGFVADHPVSLLALAEAEPVVERALQYRAAGAREAGVRHFIDFVSGAGFYDSAPAQTRQIFLDNEPAFGMRANAPLTCVEASSVSVPVLMVLGERSPPYMSRLLSGALECLRGVETVVIPAASHGIHYEQPEAFNRAVFEFLAAH